jgi:hypothetical protein
MDAIRFVVGLGNPGRKYENTPHNLGRRLADFLKERDGLAWKKEALYEWTDSKPSSIRLETYMNLSGDAVREILRRFRGTPAKPKSKNKITKNAILTQAAATKRRPACSAPKKPDNIDKSKIATMSSKIKMPKTA